MMRKVNKNFNEVPEALQNGFERIKKSLLKNQARHSFDSRIYNNSIISELRSLYQDKCAYCETFLDRDLTVDHYRPKGGRNSYWWLGYEWSNLIPLCTKCNNHKGDKFPVAVPENSNKSNVKTRVKNPILLPDGQLDTASMKADHEYLLSEQPYLLHPDIDEPQLFLTVTNTGEVEPKANQEEDNHGNLRATETIKIVNLNRDTLVINRRRILEQLQKRLRHQLILFVKYDPNVLLPLKEQYEAFVGLAFLGIFEDIDNNRSNTEQEYTLVRWQLWHNLGKLLFEPVCEGNGELRKLLDVALQLYKEKNQ